MMVQNQSQLGEGSVILTDPHHTPTIIPPSTQPQKIQQPKKPKRKDTQVPQPSDPIENIPDETVQKELGDSLVRAITTASSLEAEQDSETMGDTTAQTRFESLSKHSNDSLLSKGNTLRSDEDSLKLDELMPLCTTLQNRVLDLEKTTTTQRNEIASLKWRVKKLEKKNRSRTHKLKRLYKVGLTVRVESSGNEESLGEDASKQATIDAIDADEEITLIKHKVAVKGVNDEVNVFEEVVEVINIAKLIINVSQVSTIGDKVSAASATTTDKGKGILIEHVIEPVKPMKRKDQIRLDEEAVLKLQAEFDEKERLVIKKAKKVKESNITLIETWDDIQAKIDDDHQLAKRMQAQEQEELTELVEGKEKRAGTELIQEITKKQKVKDDKEIAELKKFMEIIPDEEEVAIDVIPLSVKSLNFLPPVLLLMMSVDVAVAVAVVVVVPLVVFPLSLVDIACF
uniref:Uncharacterized protein n=1 Tax=Tanacetum cinerariifolium TaxID=118510 RepID=A0A699IWP4_TANCI|nr:hypothetical protein [Tanacetum cinerariifolium]